MARSVATDELNASSIEGRYRLLVDAITDYAIYMLDLDGRVVSWNSGAERSKGYLADEIIGSHFSRFYPETERAAGTPERALAEAAGTGRYESEGWRVRKDGTRYWAHVVIDAIRDPDGRLLGYAKITRDLSERRKAEEQLRQSQEQFRLIVEGVTDYAIYLLDPAGYVSTWNAGAQRIKGYSHAEIVGAHFSQFYTEEDRANGEPARALEIATREGRFEKEGVRIRKDGSRFFASVVIDAIRDETGALIGFAKVTRDITEKREAQRALDQAREELFQAQKMEAVGQLTGGVAHDFNNLLMAILGSLEILRKRVPQTEDILPLIDNAMQGAQRGAALTQRMLAFSRRQELKFEAVDVLSLVGSMAELLQRSIGAGITIETRFPLRLPRVKSDPNQLATALLNLVVNARDAMPDGGQLIIGAEEGSFTRENGERLRGICLRVIDAGEGMDAETLENATTPFFTTKGVGKGTGLGLSMVKGLMEQTGGRLILQSTAGKGTTAELWLPLAPEEAETGEPAPVAAPEPQAPRALRVLAVDDDVLVLMNTVLLLEDLGHTVVEAHSGDQALSLIETAGPFDLVITDHAMPRMTGSQLAQELRRRAPALPVILATGYAELPPGGDTTLARLAKPFSQRDLETVIARAAAGMRQEA